MKVAFNRILCATDLSDFSNNAVYHAIAVAREFEAKLYLCHVVNLPPIVLPGGEPVYSEDIEDSLTDHAYTHLEHLMARQPVSWEPLIIKGPVAESIATFAHEKKIDLAVAATHGRTGLKRLFLGSVTERLMRTIACPLLIVTSPEHSAAEISAAPLAFKRIMVGCDFSSDADFAINYGLSLAQEFQSEIHLIHVLEPAAVSGVWIPEAFSQEVNVNLRDRVIDRLNEHVSDDVHNWCRVKAFCLTGIPFIELANHALANEIDLVVMGIRGHGLVESLLVGSTTERVIRQVTCPVLSVNPV